MVGSKGKSDQGSVALIGEKFQGATPGAAQGGAQVDLRGEMLRDVSIWQCHIDFELGLMAEIIFTESTAEEKCACLRNGMRSRCNCSNGQ